MEIVKLIFIMEKKDTQFGIARKTAGRNVTDLEIIQDPKQQQRPRKRLEMEIKNRLQVRTDDKLELESVSCASKFFNFSYQCPGT